MDENELLELFSAFDDVSAPESLKSSTLDFIMSAAAAPVAGAGAAEATQPMEAAQPAQAAEPAQAPAHAAPVAATRGGKARIRGKWHAIRVAAVAACLTLALTGGAAYAIPTSTVLLTQGDTTVELKVNVFGQVVSASSNDEAAQGLIDELGLVHTSSDDSITRVKDSLEESNPDVKVTVIKDGVAQAEESGDDQPASQPEPEPKKPLHSGESAVLQVSAPAQAEQPATAAVLSTTPAVTISLPDPTGSTSGDDGSSSPGDGSHDTQEPDVPVVVDPDPDPTPEDPSDDDDPTPAPEPEPQPEPEPEPAPEPQPEPEPEPEPTYDNDRPPLLFDDLL